MPWLRFRRHASFLVASFLLGCGGATEDSSNVSRDPTGGPPSASFAPAADDEQEGSEGEAPEELAPIDAGVPSSDAEPGDAAPSDGGSSKDAAVDAKPTDKPAAQILAEEAARQLEAMKVTVYQHTTFVDESTGTFKYDCSGFINYALERTLESHLAAIKTFNGVTRPRAKDYHNFFASISPTSAKSGWARVVRAIDLRPGDVVAWLKPADLVSTNTGHVMIVRALPTLSTKRADEVLVPITDSTSSPHGPSDSRAPDGEGLGTGTIGLIVDSSGKPIRYRWTGGYSTKEWVTSIALGRPQ